jgi:hypothetical protein
MTAVTQLETPITHWLSFGEQVRSNGRPLLQRLDEFPHSVLVTGCQRSGTTMLSRIITESDGMINYWFGQDDELAAALILAGVVEHQPQPEGRYCFQTTYLNERYAEYFAYNGRHKIIWVLRNPYSVVYSMCYNWKRYALDELFMACGVDHLAGLCQWRYKLLGRRGISPGKRACYAYAGKVSQLFELQKKLDQDTLLVIDYDDLVQNKTTHLPQIYDFIQLPYRPVYADKIHAKSLSKARQLNTAESRHVEQICMPIYTRARKLVATQE